MGPKKTTAMKAAKDGKRSPNPEEMVDELVDLPVVVVPDTPSLSPRTAAKVQ